MTYVLTFVASTPAAPLTDGHIREAASIAAAHDLAAHSTPAWLSPGKAADLEISGKGEPGLLAQIREFLSEDKIDLFITPHAGRRKKLLLADMDATIVEGETLDDLAAHAGIKDAVAAITARAMNGEIDFHAAIKERVALLKNLPVTALQETLEKTIINPGAKTLIATMKKHGGTCVLVSGGFTFFTGAVAGKVGFDHNHGNSLGIESEQLTGEVIPPILDKFAKVEFLDHYCRALGLEAQDAMTIGDGANDLPMLRKAGLGLGYHAKPSVAAELKNLVVHGDLSAPLYAQGYSDSDFA
jgi:phosphoserine phosphatase